MARYNKNTTRDKPNCSNFKLNNLKVWEGHTNEAYKKNERFYFR